MRLPGYSVAFLLAVLLVSTTPVGTGAGMHQFDLLHPLFSHVHVVNGRIVTHDQLAERGLQLTGGTTNSPALGAGGGGVADGGFAISPVSVPPVAVFEFVRSAQWLIEVSEMATGREEAPPDPPPVT